MFNAYIAVPVAVWAITQLTKFTVSGIRGDIDLHNLYKSGGMPSVHSAVVCSLATTALALDGWGSHLFGFTLIFAGIVMYDSLGVRRAAGEQGAALNMIISSLKYDRVRLSQPDLELREVRGHTPKEVAVGALVGVFFGLLFNYQHIQPLTTWLGTIPSHIELAVYALIGLLSILGSLATYFVLSRRHSAALLSVARRILVMGLTMGIIMGGFVFAAFEKVNYLSSRFWPLLTIVLLVVWGSWLYFATRGKLATALTAEAEAARKDKWLPKGKKHKKKAK
jgi:acid phosphatase family membrane protein YuiD